MESRNKTISNLYIPGKHSSLRYINLASKVNTTASINIKGKDKVNSPEIPFGMIDFCKRNSNYLKVIQNFDIVDHSNSEYYEEYKSNYGKKQIALKSDKPAQESMQIQMLFDPLLKEISIDDKNEIVDLFDNTNLKISSLSAISGIDQFIVKRILKQNNRMKKLEKK